MTLKLIPDEEMVRGSPMIVARERELSGQNKGRWSGHVILVMELNTCPSADSYSTYWRILVASLITYY